MELVAASGRARPAPTTSPPLVRAGEHHLLLPDVAVRRDLADPATIRKVADAVGDVATLELLHALTEADSLATGASAWGSWKEQLVADLVERTRHVLDGGDAEATDVAPFPDRRTLATMAAGPLRRADRADDRPATSTAPSGSPSCATTSRARSPASPACCRCAGLDVLTAWAYSGELGGPAMAASQFRVVPPRRVAWDRLVEDLRTPLAGELAIEARLAERARTYRRRARRRPPGQDRRW